MAQWNVLDAVYLQEISVALKEIEPTGLFFKPDGTKFYTTGQVGDSVDEYDLGVQWDVSTAVYLHEFDVSGEEGKPTGLFFKPDGTKMYIIGKFGLKVVEYDLGTQWDVTTAVYLNDFDVSPKEIAPEDLTLKPDGTKMYTVGSNGITIDEYDLGTQWDVSTAVFLQEVSLAAKEITPTGMFFKPDGTKFYTVGQDGDSVDEYDLGTQWDISTAVYLREISVAAKEVLPQSIMFKPDGTKMYTVGMAGDSVDEYDLM